MNSLEAEEIIDRPAQRQQRLPVPIDIVRRPRDNRRYIPYHFRLYQRYNLRPNIASRRVAAQHVPAEAQTVQSVQAAPNIEPLAPPSMVVKCPICIDGVRNPIATTCGHIFCENCILTAMQVRSECPMCKTAFGSGSRTYQKIFIDV